MSRRVFRSSRVVLPDGVRPAAVIVRDGVIESVAAYDATADGTPGGGTVTRDAVAAATDIVDFGTCALLPGLVDTHVHVNEPGRTAWEGFGTATRAAAAGGVTALVDMPLNSIPATTTASALAVKRAAAAGQCHVDVGFWGGVVPENTRSLRALARAGALGFKCFLVPSGVPEFAAADERALDRALPIVAELGLPLLVHAEAPEYITAPAADADRRAYAGYLATRPDSAEVAAVVRMCTLARQHGARVHVVHVSSAAAVSVLAGARARGVPVTAETCPHYLHFAAHDVPAGATEYKCAPPIRTRTDRDRLWHGLDTGALDMVVSDHSPCPPALKRTAGDFHAAWGGIAALELGLSVTWTGAAARGHGIERLAHWLSAAPAALAGLGATKGAIAPGRDADLVAFDSDAEWQVDARTLVQRHKLTPYDGALLRGRVVATVLRGEFVHARGGGGRTTDAPAGRLLGHAPEARDGRGRVT